jgi:hypothetical protein
MRLGLVPPRSEQSVPVFGDARRQLADRRSRELLATETQPVVFRRGRTR